MTGIIILNWNGWKDTIECLKSLFVINDTEYFIILVDNGSTNDSVKQINKFLKNHNEIDFYTITESQKKLPHIIRNKTCVLYNLSNNYGFAGGNNKGIEVAKNYEPEYFLLLNNDTIVEPDFLSKLINFNKENPQYGILTPRICYFYDKNIVWNCGGALKWGFRKYHYADQSISKIKEKIFIDLGYITGCALFFEKDVIKDNALLTERFFHGEEDFEFSYRMRKIGRKIACVLSSHIYHKVGSSTTTLNNIGKIYIHYLNRFIDMRQQMSSLSWNIWKIVYIPYIYILLKRMSVKQTELLVFLRRLICESKSLDGVSKEKFFELLKNGIE